MWSCCGRTFSIFRTDRFFFCFVNFILFLSPDLVLISTLFSLDNVLVSVGAVSTTTLDGQMDGCMGGLCHQCPSDVVARGVPVKC